MTTDGKFTKKAMAKKFGKSIANGGRFRKPREVRDAGKDANGRLPPEYLASTGSETRARETLSELASSRG